MKIPGGSLACRGGAGFGTLVFSFLLRQASQSRLCRDAGESDTRHLGLWSVGRGKENRLSENMSKDLVYRSPEENRASKSQIDFGVSWGVLEDSSVVQAE